MLVKWQKKKKLKCGMNHRLLESISLVNPLLFHRLMKINLTSEFWQTTVSYCLFSYTIFQDKYKNNLLLCKLISQMLEK